MKPNCGASLIQWSEKKSKQKITISKFKVKKAPQKVNGEFH